MADHYKLLQVRRDASPEVIAAAYRRLMKDAHPDAGGDTDRARALNLAYETLADPASRGAYDRTLRSTSGPGPHLMVDLAYRVGVSIGRRAARAREAAREADRGQRRV